MNWGAIIGGALGAAFAFHCGYFLGREHMRQLVARRVFLVVTKRQQ